MRTYMIQLVCFEFVSIHMFAHMYIHIIYIYMYSICSMCLFMICIIIEGYGGCICLCATKGHSSAQKCDKILVLHCVIACLILHYVRTPCNMFEHGWWHVCRVMFYLSRSFGPLPILFWMVILRHAHEWVACSDGFCITPWYYTFRNWKWCLGVQNPAFSNNKHVYV